MSAKDGKPCVKCGANEWDSRGKCKRCRSERSRRWRQENPDSAAERVRKWGQENPDRKAELNRRWRQENQGKATELNRRWRQENPDSTSAIKQRRRTKKTEAGGSFTAAEFRDLRNSYGNKCLRCGRDDVKLTADHVLPIAKGGTSNIDNIQPLCASCNSSKGDRHIDYRPDAGIARWIQAKLFG